MSMLVYNLTAAPLVLANGLGTTIPASSAGAGVRGRPWYASGNELAGRSGAQYIALQVQQDAGDVAFQWENSPEYPTVGLTVSSDINAAPLSVVTASIAALAVTTAKIAANAVDETKVALTMASAPQALSGPGAVDVASRTTLFTSTGTGDALTLANGVRAGQRKSLVYTAEAAGADTGVLTPATPGNFATATLNDKWDSVELEWSGSVWNVVSYGGSAVVA
jgi:hypothetical protein